MRGRVEGRIRVPEGWIRVPQGHNGAVNAHVGSAHGHLLLDAQLGHRLVQRVSLWCGCDCVTVSDPLLAVMSLLVH